MQTRSSVACARTHLKERRIAVCLPVSLTWSPLLRFVGHLFRPRPRLTTAFQSCRTGYTLQGRASARTTFACLKQVPGCSQVLKCAIAPDFVRCPVRDVLRSPPHAGKERSAVAPSDDPTTTPAGESTKERDPKPWCLNGDRLKWDERLGTPSLYFEAENNRSTITGRPKHCSDKKKILREEKTNLLIMASLLFLKSCCSFPMEIRRWKARGFLSASNFGVEFFFKL